MVNSQFIIKKNEISWMLITSVRVDLPNYLGTWKRTYFDHKCTFTTVCCLLKSSQVTVRFDMPEDNLRSIKNILSFFVFEIIFDVEMTFKSA